MTEINLLELGPGTRIALLDGAVAEVVENPRDGVWLFCRYLSHPDDATLVDGRERPVFAHDIQDVLAAGDELQGQAQERENKDRDTAT